MTEVAEAAGHKTEQVKEAPILVAPERMDWKDFVAFKQGLNNRAKERLNADIASRQEAMNRITSDPDAVKGDVDAANTELTALDGEARAVIAEANTAADAVIGEQRLPSGSVVGNPEKGTALTAIDTSQAGSGDTALGEQRPPSDFVIGDPSKGTALNVVDTDGRLARQFEQSRQNADNQRSEALNLPKMYQPGTPEYMYSQLKSEQDRSRQLSQDEIHSGKPPSIDHAAVRERLRAQQQLLSQALLAKGRPSPEVARAYQRDLENIIATEKTRQWAYARKETDPAKIAAHQEWQEKVFRGADFQKIADNARAEADKLRLEWEANGPSDDLDARFGVEEDAIREYQLYAYLKNAFSAEDSAVDATAESVGPDVEDATGADIPATDDKPESAITGELSDQQEADAELTAETDDGTEQDAEDIDDDDDESTVTPVEAPAPAAVATEATTAVEGTATEAAKPAETRTPDPEKAKIYNNLNQARDIIINGKKDGSFTQEKALGLTELVLESLEGSSDPYQLLQGADVLLSMDKTVEAVGLLERTENSNELSNGMKPKDCIDMSVQVSGRFIKLGMDIDAANSLHKAEQNIDKFIDDPTIARRLLDVGLRFTEMKDKKEATRILGRLNELKQDISARTLKARIR